MDLQIVFPCLLLLIGCTAYIFRPPAKIFFAPVAKKTRLDYLRERKDVIYDNLRDLNFEYSAGKFPQEDYLRQRDALESEAAHVLAEMDTFTSTLGG